MTGERRVARALLSEPSELGRQGFNEETEVKVVVKEAAFQDNCDGIGIELLEACEVFGALLGCVLIGATLAWSGMLLTPGSIEHDWVGSSKFGPRRSDSHLRRQSAQWGGKGLKAKPKRKC